MLFNKKLIKQLEVGEIVLHYNENNLELLRAVLTETFPKDKWQTVGADKYYYKSFIVTGKDAWSCNKYMPSKYMERKLVQISDFLLPEPRFQKGDKVKVKDQKDEVWVIRSSTQHPETGNWAYLLESSMYNMNVSEGLLELVTEPEQFIVGNQYEFSQDQNHWAKGTLLGVIDHIFKYVALRPDRNDGNPLTFRYARPIQLKEVVIERWVNMSQSGNQVGRKCYESKMEACQHAPQSQNVFQVKLAGTYTI